MRQQVTPFFGFGLGPEQGDQPIAAQAGGLGADRGQEGEPMPLARAPADTLAIPFEGGGTEQ